jgi:radical SAM superfamily enzyme YgiQ (UPF0313 family)
MSTKNKVILFFPKTHEESLHWFRTPLSVMAVARMAEKDFVVEIIDERVEEDAYERVAISLKDALCVGISALTGTQIKYALRIAKFVKEMAPEVPIVWGGWHPSVMSEQTAMHPFVDIVVRGQGEITFRELLEVLHDNRPFDDILGITYKKENKIISNPDRPLRDINEFPPMPYHLVNVEKYIGQPILGECDRVISYMSSQGCPHRCAFCADARVYKRRWTALDGKRVVNELEELSKKYDIKGFYFEDSNFFANPERVKTICKEIIDRGLNIKWEAEVRTEKFVKADRELKDLVKRSGCYQLLVGAESGSQEVLDMIDKDATVKDTIEFVKQAKELSIIPLLSLMVGLPSVKEDTETTVKLMRDVKLLYSKSRIYLFFYTPYPGTKLYETALKNGLEAPASLDAWADYTLNRIQTPWVNKKYQGLTEILTFYFTLAYPSEYHISPGDPLLIKLLKKFISLLTLVRLKVNFFRFPFEFFLEKKYVTLKARHLKKTQNGD